MNLEVMEPDIVVGIDFGVAYSMGPDWPAPKTLQHWPGKLGNELVNKVATAIAYDGRTGYPATWGFLCDPDNYELETQEYFKLYLDPAHQDTFREAPTIEEARQWFRDYLHCIYEQIKRVFTDSLPRWQNKQVEFLFSVPTTWKNPALIAVTEKLIKEAGFGEKANHKVKISLTEAEAAAVYASKSSYDRGDVFMVCDAGGGTTDLNVLKLSNSGSGKTELEPLSWVEGQSIGSTLIDFRVTKLITERLETIRHHIQGEPRDVAERMMRGRFETFKCSFGVEASNVPILPLPVPGLSPGQDFPQARVADSKLIITKEELQRIFDEQMEKLFKLIDEQLKRLQMSHARESISYLVLSGGLGSSPYVRKCLKIHYEDGVGGFYPNAQDMKVLVAEEPQLAVVHGLVMDRTQEINQKIVVYSQRCCRASYGIISRQVYDPIQHQGEDVVIDPRDKQKWAERQIHWFIQQGQVIHVKEGIKQNYRLKIDLGKEQIPWQTQVVMSALPAGHLPRSMRHPGVKTLCAIEAVLDPVDMKRKNRHWYNLSPEYNRADFDVKVLIGAADIKFELWGKNGKKSKDHSEIAVQWEPPPQHMASPGVDASSGMYRV